MGAAVCCSWSQAVKDAQAREMEVLRRTLAEQKRNPDKIIPTPQTPRWFTNSPLYPKCLELERAFLDGKLTAKGYQRSLDALRRGEPNPEEGVVVPAGAPAKPATASAIIAH